VLPIARKSLTNSFHLQRSQNTMNNTVIGLYMYIKVGIGTTNGLDNWHIIVQFLAGERDFSKMSISALWLIQSAIQWVPGGHKLISQSGKGMHRKTSHVKSYMHTVFTSVQNPHPCQCIFATILEEWISACSSL
jgi:hypothetical protein